MTVETNNLSFFNLCFDGFDSKTVTNHIRNVISLRSANMVKGQNHWVAFPTVSTWMCCKISCNKISCSLYRLLSISFYLCFSSFIHIYNLLYVQCVHRDCITFASTNALYKKPGLPVLEGDSVSYFAMPRFLAFFAIFPAKLP